MSARPQASPEFRALRRRLRRFVFPMSAVFLAWCLAYVPPGSTKSASMIQGIDFHWFPLDNPGIVAIPLSFLLGIIGTWVGNRRGADLALYAAMEVRALTGAGAEVPTGLTAS